ncbi:MAG: hypothetical protein QOI95_1701 [Acidimicrobiaceae bacterium]|jgi:hypothetical protein
MDWQGTPEDPHGYMKLRDFMSEAAARVAAAGHTDAAERLRVAGSWVGMPSEWMGESALALKTALALDDLPGDLAVDLNDALSAIRTGFQRVGHIPNF